MLALRRGAPEQAAALFRAEADAGSAEAHFLLGSLLRARPELRQPEGAGGAGGAGLGAPTAEGSLARAAQMGEPRAQFEVAQGMWDRGDADGALLALHAAAAQGHVRPLRPPRGTSCSSAERAAGLRRRYPRPARAQAEALNTLGVIAAEGCQARRRPPSRLSPAAHPLCPLTRACPSGPQGVVRDPAAAFAFWTTAAAAGSADAGRNLAQLGSALAFPGAVPLTPGLRRGGGDGGGDDCVG